MDIITKPLTAKQDKLLQHIKDFVAANHIAPTVRELAALMGWYSSSTCHNSLMLLKEKGHIEWSPGSPRSMRLVDRDAV